MSEATILNKVSIKPITDKNTKVNTIIVTIEVLGEWHYLGAYSLQDGLRNLDLIKLKDMIIFTYQDFETRLGTESMKYFLDKADFRYRLLEKAIKLTEHN